VTPIRLLTFSTLFPNNARPNHGVFVENRLRHLVASGNATSEVIAPVPWFPSAHPWFGDWAVNARVAARETRHGLIVRHPRFPVIPKVGMSIAPMLLYRATAPLVRRLFDEQAGFDAIDAHYLYPDGVAAVWLGQRFGLPVVLTARGTDVSLIPQFMRPRQLILRAVADAAAVIAVSAALRDALVEIGVSAGKISVLRNGVDTALFRPPVDRVAARADLGFVRPTLISVGLLIERKGHHRTIEAMTQLPDFDLVIAGEGPERNRLNALISRLGLGERVRLAGAVAHAELPRLYGAADASVLSSSREGWANVLLESMACGTPVVASPIWGNPEAVRDPAAGVITRENSAGGIAESVRRLFAALPASAATREYAEGFSWDETTEGQLALFRRVVAEHRANGT
jgi:glycosyltransferase involved in cell wall biosynthesis